MNFLQRTLYTLLILSSPLSLFAQQDRIPKNVIPSNPVDYDVKTLAYWGHVAPLTVRFREDTILIGDSQEDTLYFPTSLPLKEMVYYVNRRGDTTVELTRLTYTHVAFRMECFAENGLDNIHVGTAVLSTRFYMGAAGTFEDEGGNIFEANAYALTTRDGWKGQVLIPAKTDEWVGVYIQKGHKTLSLNLAKEE